MGRMAGWEAGGQANLNTAQCGSDLSTTPDNPQVPFQAKSGRVTA
jgi:hypothetical protein